jgi:thymidylate synthase ThyX
MDSHAQYEIQVYAKAMLQLITPIVPLAVEAYEEYSFGSVTFSKTEMRILKELLAVSVNEDVSSYNLKNYARMAAYNNDWSERRTNAFIEKIGLDKL